MFVHFGVIFFTLFFGSEALKYQTKNGLLPTKEECGQDFSHKFPWMAYIRAQTRTYNPSADIRCAGTLISKRYVILNKSCLQFYIISDKVRLGQDDITKEDTALELDIKEKVVDETIDIVLLRLSEDVAFSNKVRPICLPFEDFIKPTPGETVYTSGWGLTSYNESASNTKKSVKGTFEGTCNPSANQMKVSNSICVTVQDSSNDKPCSGDDGSPIMYDANGKWVLQGVLVDLFESNNKPCAIEEAAVGSKITENVLQWIVDKIY